MESNQQDNSGQQQSNKEGAPAAPATAPAASGETTDQHINIKVKSQVSIVPPLRVLHKNFLEFLSKIRELSLRTSANPWL